MILTEYDIINTTVDRKKPFVDISRKTIVCRLKKIPKYYLIAKKYIKSEDSYDYFIITTNDRVEGCKNLNMDDYGRVKFFIGSIWRELAITEDKNFNISLDVIDSDDSATVYKITY